MNVARDWRADDVSVRLCFLVKVRNATGRRVVGGSRMGRMEAFGDGAIGLRGLKGCTGVPKPGEEERIAVDAEWAGVSVIEGMVAVRSEDRSMDKSRPGESRGDGRH
jgi:hypothetical protein